MHELDNALLAFGITSPLSRKLFLEKAMLRELPKNQVVFADNSRNGFEYLLLKGVLHRFNVSDKGDVVTTGFYMPQAVITPHFARTYNGKSIFTLETLTEVLLSEIPVKTLDDLRSSNDEFRQFGQRILESELSKMFYLEVVNRSFSAKERLLLLRQNYQNLENLIPHNIIASYLGITNVSFSRLRSELSKGI